MKIPKLLHKKTSNPSESNDDDDDVEVERGETIGEGEGTDPGQTEASQEAGQKKADNQAILQLLGEGEKVGKMDTFNKTEAAMFPMQAMLLEDFLFF